jgi:hypothetical protein
MSNWGSPLQAKKKAEPKAKEKEQKEEKFVRTKLRMSQSEAKKVLAYKEPLAYGQIQWTQNWLEQKIREKSLPPQLAGGEALAQILLWLSPDDSTKLLNELRTEFRKTLFGQKGEDKDELSFLDEVEVLL